MQQEASLRSPSPCATLPADLGEREEGKGDQVYLAAPESLPSDAEGNTGLMDDAQELIKFITQRYQLISTPLVMCFSCDYCAGIAIGYAGHLLTSVAVWLLVEKCLISQLL